MRELRALDTLNPVVLIDGQSGAGKSRLAAGVVGQRAAAGRGELIAGGPIYSGGGGPESAVAISRADILVRPAPGRVGGWG